MGGFAVHNNLKIHLYSSTFLELKLPDESQ
jgi:hypothetical protein